MVESPSANPAGYRSNFLSHPQHLVQNRDHKNRGDQKMKKTFAILGVLQALLLVAFAQSAADPLERAYLEHDEANQILRLKWWARSGRTYFIQHSEDLVYWNSFPVVESGADAIMEYGVAYTPTSASKLFLRVKSTTHSNDGPQRG